MKELSKDSKFSISVETLVILGSVIVTVVGMWFTLNAEIDEAKKLPPSEVSRTEYDLKDQLIRETIINILCNIKTTNHMDAIIGNNIKSLRIKLGLNQEDIAEYLGLSRQQIIRYEKGESAVPTDNLTKLAELFSVDEYDFYEENVAKVNANLAFAFRADELQGDDLKTIAAFKKIAMNYLKMKEALAND